VNKKTLRIAVPIALAAIIVGVLLGVFLPGGKESAPDGGPQTAARTSESAAPDAKTEGGKSAVVERAKPTFDVVRIAPSGEAVIAGRAEPGAEISVLENGQEIGRVTANEHGEWVVTPAKKLEPGSRELTLKDVSPNGGADSEEVVVLSVPERKAAGGKEQEQEQEQALAVLTPKKGGPSRVLQLAEPQKEPPAGQNFVSIDSIDYDDKGEIVIAGRANKDVALNVYADNIFLGSVRSDQQGHWSIKPGATLEPGNHVLRVDQIDQDGKVIARVETPFSRAEPNALALASDQVVIVQPGNSLWRIARRVYGGGMHYTAIFRANSIQIRDPDMIYPGQVFTVPPLS
jgi:nucleoid-associated protein YgaU